MKFTVETELERNIDDVWRAFANVDNLRIWMPTLTDFQQISGPPGEPGSVSRLVFVENGRSIAMDETVLSNRAPFEFSARYDSGHGVNVVANRFELVAGGRTKWTLDALFQFKGLMRFLAFLFKGIVRKRLTDDCARFKVKLEAGALAS